MNRLLLALLPVLAACGGGGELPDPCRVVQAAYIANPAGDVLLAQGVPGPLLLAQGQRLALAMEMDPALVQVGPFAVCPGE